MKIQECDPEIIRQIITAWSDNDFGKVNFFDLMYISEQILGPDSSVILVGDYCYRILKILNFVNNNRQSIEDLNLVGNTGTKTSIHNEVFNAGAVCPLIENKDLQFDDMMNLIQKGMMKHLEKT